MAGKKEDNLPMAWQAELLAQAQEAAQMESSVATGQFFGLKGGVLSWNDNPLPNNEMACIIVDSVLENVYFEDAYDPETPQSPVCYAFGRSDAEMQPHKDVVESGKNVCEFCKDCENNRFGTANVGKGKACRNVRRLAIIPAGTLKNGRFEMFENKETFEDAEIGFMKLPVTSVKAYAAFVKQLAGALGRPPHGVITRIFLTPDNKTIFKVGFEVIENVPDEIMPVIMERHNEAKTLIDFPYPPFIEEEKPKTKKPAARGKGRKY